MKLAKKPVTLFSAIQDGQPQLLFASPEVTTTTYARKILKALKNRIKLIVVDEAHCLHKW